MNNIIQFLRKNTYRKEISTIIILKLAGLFLLWGLCFSHTDKTGIHEEMMLMLAPDKMR